MWDFSLLKATQAIEKNFAYTIYRLLNSLGIGAAYIGGLLFGAGIGFAIGGRLGSAEAVAALGAVSGLAVCGGLVYWYRKTLFFSVKGGSIGLVVELIQGHSIPAGKSQVKHAKELVKKRFAQPASLFEVDEKIKGVMITLLRKSTGWGKRLPVPDNSWLATILNQLLAMPLAYSHQALIGFCMKNKDVPVWRSAKNGLVLYAQNFNKLWTNTLWLLTLVASAWIAVFILIWIPIGWAFDLIPSAVSPVWQAIFALILSWVVKAAYFDTIALGSMIELYLDTVEGLEPDPEWDGQLDSISADYRDIKAKAPKSPEG